MPARSSWTKDRFLFAASGYAETLLKKQHQPRTAKTSDRYSLLYKIMTTPAVAIANAKGEKNQAITAKAK
jgi:hypothetical protein